jgi:hypothetical protein
MGADRQVILTDKHNRGLSKSFREELFNVGAIDAVTPRRAAGSRGTKGELPQHLWKG